MQIASLTHLYTPLGLLTDRDGDGLPDGLAARFVVGRTPGAIDVAARLGLESCALTPGFTRPDAPGVVVYFGPENEALPPVEVPDGCGVVALTPDGVVVTGATSEQGWAAARWLAEVFPLVSPEGPTLERQAGGRAVRRVVLQDGRVVALELGDLLPAEAAPDKPTFLSAPPAPPFRSQAPGDLPPEGPAQLFTVAGLMGSSDSAQHDRAGWQVAVGPDVTPEEIAALCELAARTGVEATGLRFPLAVPAERQSQLVPGGAPAIGDREASGASAAVRSGPDGVPALSGPAPGAIPDAECQVPTVVLAEEPPANPRWQEGHLAWTGSSLVAFGSPSERAAALRQAAEAGLVDGIHATLFTRRAALPEQPVGRGPLIFDLPFVLRWEVDRFREAWRALLPRLKPGVPVQVDLRLSEPREICQALAAEMRRDLAAKGISVEALHVRSAYKQGFCWLEEEVLPHLQSLGTVQRVALNCRPFGAGDDKSGVEAPPSGAGEAERGAGVVRSDAGGAASRAKPSQVAAGTASTGVGAAHLGGGTAGAKPDAAQLGAGVSPASGKAGQYRGPEGTVRDGRSLDLPIRWLQEVYPADELLSQALGGIPVEFGLAEAPQEHVYQLTAWDGEGRVLYTAGFDPVWNEQPYLPDDPRRGRVHPPTGRLQVTQDGVTIADRRIETDLEAIWTLYQDEVLPRLKQYILDTYGPKPDPRRQPFFGALVVEVAVSEEDRRLGIRQEQISPPDALHEDLYFYTLDYLNELGLSRTGQGYPAPGAVEPWIHTGEGEPKLRVRLYGLPAAEQEEGGLPERAAVLPDPAPGIPADRIIGPEELPACLAYLARLPGIRVWRTGLSYGGRATWALSVTAPTAGRIAPPQKLSAWRPTLLVNARHHANEVSSTNSILQLAEYAAREGLVRRLNLVLSPMENVDGAALHYRMQEEHPYWKLHAARFNAAGVDFGYDCFAPVPRFGESRTLPTLWRTFLPDVVLDDHGYPSQEWVQPFAGYNSPPYFRTSWWMPNALIYGIHRWLDSERFPANGAVQAGIRDALAERLTADQEIAVYSARLLERYVTYAQRYVPEKFPLELHRGFVSQVGSIAAGPDARSFAGRFPHITAAELVTEVPDETAQGSYLALCARAHLEGDLAVCHYLAAHPQPVVRRRWEEKGAVYWAVGRSRPLRP